MRTKKTIKPVAALVEVPSDENPLTVGAPVFIRTVTIWFIGVIVKIIDQGPGVPAGGYLLKQCVCVMNTGPFQAFIQTGSIRECDAYLPKHRVFINAKNVVDAARWYHALPQE